MSDQVWGQHMAPVNAAAGKAAPAPDPETVSEDATRKLIGELYDQRDALKIRKAEIDCELEEAAQQYHRYGVASPAGWFKGRKIEQVQVESKLRRIQDAIEELKRKRTASRAQNVAMNFMQVAKNELPAEQFFSLLRRAEAIASASRANFEHVD